MLGASLERAGRPAEALIEYEAAAAMAPKDRALQKIVERLRALPGPGGGAARVFSKIPAGSAATGFLEEQLRIAFGPLLPGPLAATAKTAAAPDLILEMATKEVTRVVAYRAEVEKDGAHALGYVVIESPAGDVALGPVASSFVPRGGPLLNDYTVDLQPIDVRPGGGPEIVVRIDERRTFADVALNELVEVDETRALLLSMDGGTPVLSREVILSSNVRRTALDAKSKKLPKDYSTSSDLGKARGYDMKVAWSGPSQMTLTKLSGAGTPRDQGVITLFP